jgi:hypothetical protein
VAESGGREVKVTDVATILPDGRVLTTNQTFRVRNSTGTFKWLGVTGQDGSLTCWGGPSGHEMTRYFKPDRIARISRPT